MARLLAASQVWNLAPTRKAGPRDHADTDSALGGLSVSRGILGGGRGLHGGAVIPNPCVSPAGAQGEDVSAQLEESGYKTIWPAFQIRPLQEWLTKAFQPRITGCLR